MDTTLIRQQAEDEVRAELHRRAVEAEKQRIRERAKRSWFKRIFPFTVKIERSN